MPRVTACRPRRMVLRPSTICAGKRPDVVVLDLEMPVMDGWSLLRSCRGLPELADLPVIAMSGMQDALATLADLDVDTYLHKPFDLEELALAIGEPESASVDADARCSYCEADGPGRTLRVFSKEQPLGHWKLCERCWRFLELGSRCSIAGGASPSDSARPFRSMLSRRAPGLPADYPICRASQLDDSRSQTGL